MRTAVQSRPAPTDPRASNLARAAFEYAEVGLPVLPCRPRAKEPLTPDGLLDATTERREIEGWWRRWPTANVAVALTPELVVVDVDGLDGRRSLQAADLALPSSVTARTGRTEGRHVWYQTAEPLQNRIRLFDGIDVKAAGGYVLVPPSIHPSGRAYAWEVPFAWDNLAPAPTWLTEQAKPVQVREPREWRELVGEGVAAGSRNDSIASIAGHLLRRHVHPYVTLELVRAFNEARCRPPLSDREVVRTVDSIANRELRRREGKR